MYKYTFIFSILCICILSGCNDKSPIRTVNLMQSDYELNDDTIPYLVLQSFIQVSDTGDIYLIQNGVSDKQIGHIIILTDVIKQKIFDLSTKIEEINEKNEWEGNYDDFTYGIRLRVGETDKFGFVRPDINQSQKELKRIIKDILNNPKILKKTEFDLTNYIIEMDSIYIKFHAPPPVMLESTFKFSVPND